MMLKQFSLALIPLLFVATISNVYAGGPRYDSPDTPDPGVGQCWVDGFDDGANNDYDEDRSKECGEPENRYEGSNVYRDSFDIGLRCLNPDLYEHINEDCDAAREEANLMLVSTESEKPEIVDPIPTETGSKCPEGYSRTDDGDQCQLKEVQCDETPDDPLCNGERGRRGNIFCDIQYQEGGSGTCYDRNDNPEEYCLTYKDDNNWFFCTKENICDEDGSVKPDDKYCTD
jgi:hypothetical protein